jgi:hypothetical protein
MLLWNELTADLVFDPKPPSGVPGLNPFSSNRC